MRRFRDVLVITDPTAKGQTNALQRAFDLAQRNEARLTLAAVVADLPDEPLPGVSQDELRELAVADWSRGLTRLAAPARRRGIDLAVDVLVGRPFVEIIRRVLREGHDLVIVTAEGRPRVDDLLFGATSMQLLRKCPCPLWIVKPGRRKRYGRILAAVDPDPYAGKAQGVERTVLELAASQARLDRSELHVVHAWQLGLGNLLRRPSGMSRRRVLEYERKVREAHRASVRDLLAHVDTAGLTSRIHVKKGDPREVVPRVVRGSRIDLLVMGTLGRGRLAGLFIGSTAETILHRVACAVLAVKPREFESPVALED